MARKWLKRIAFVLLTLAALYFCALFFIGRLADKRLEAELTAIREKGEPLLLTEMAPPPVPDEQNAAISLRRAADLLVQEEDDAFDAMNLLLQDPLGADEEAAALAQAWLDRNQPAIAAIEEALDRPGCRFDYDYSSAETILEPASPGAFQILDSSDLLAMRGILSARAGDVPAACDDVIRLLRLSALASADPLLLHALVRVACEGKALTALGAALRQGAPGSERRDELIAALDAIDLHGELHRALLGERCFGRSLFEIFPDNRDLGGTVGALAFNVGELPAVLLRAAPAAVIRLDQSRYLSLMARTIDLCAKPAFETRDQWAALEQDLDDPPWYGLLSQLALISMSNSYQRIEAHRARLDLARIALDLEHAKKITGQLPDTLLLPATEGFRGATDPFSGRDYRFKRVGDDGYTLWSVGPNRTDDDATDGEEDGYDTGDVVWRK